ncbi:MAG: hypothetical protein A2636_02370 [Elusimicrobia bacterium RIFCSPHIGHO2_01_FULL_64_10]|nr:MAG: hypothetical protein A2636_02370 [Elusimicrobia bacterium RIFCSPHIGHO2_01_FULL_64_10]
MPPPAVNGPAAGHEGRPYRDPNLFLSCPAEKLPALAKILKEDAKLGFDYLVMVTAVDHPKTTAAELARMDVVYQFYSLARRHRLVVKVSVPRENPEVPSLADLWSTADWQEREVYDMFGIRFAGHPDLRRILMWDEFPGWPLRKDYVHVPDRYDD